jgi:riboflavin kinase / FMN adenylyltransferase
MRVVTDLSQFDKSSCQSLILGLGNFDGLHLGHQKIIEIIQERARIKKGVAAVFTFREHPQRVLHQKDDPPILTSLIHKLHLLERSGVDVCFLVDFTMSFSKQKAAEFVSHVFVDQLGASEICLGFNARFGKDRAGDSGTMKALAAQLGIYFLEVPATVIGEQVISSSFIRSLVKTGDLEGAQKFLGRPYSFFGNVVKGTGRGKELGFPTLNLDIHSEVMPFEGVYAVWVTLLDAQLKAQKKCSTFGSQIVKQKLRAVLNYGTRPTFGGNSKPIPEIHFLNYKENIPSHMTIEVTFGKRLRDEKRFENSEGLKKQIKSDISNAIKWFQKERNKGGVHSCR